MAILAAVSGVLIAGFGFLVAGRAPSPAEFAAEVACFTGGVVLCFLAVVLARLKRIERHLQAPQR